MQAPSSSPPRSSGARTRTQTTSPEARLLRALCRPGQVLRAELEERAAPDLDWQRLYRLARENRVLPYVWRRLEGLLPERVPAELSAEWDELVRELAWQHLYLARTLCGLVEACAAAGIPALPYKGPVLSALYYDDLTQRQFRDVDLLVPRAAVQRTRELLASAGWQAKEELAEGELMAWLERDCELHFEHPDGISLELHWHVLPAAHTLGLSAASLWEGLVPARLAGVAIRTFPAEEWLLLLCIHGGDKHRWSRLQMILDVARLLTLRRDLAWERVAELARAVERERTVRLGVFLAWHLLGAELSPVVLAHVLCDGRTLAMAALLSERPFAEEQKLPGYRAWSAAVAEQNAHLREHGLPPGPSGFARYVLTALEPEWRDRQAFRLPPGWGFLYWGLRPLRLLLRHGLGLLRRIGSLSTG